MGSAVGVGGSVAVGSSVGAGVGVALLQAESMMSIIRMGKRYRFIRTIIL